MRRLFPLDPRFEQGADATGGAVFFQADRFDRACVLMKQSLFGGDPDVTTFVFENVVDRGRGEGDEVEDTLLYVNRKKKHIKLSMKALVPEIEEFKPAKKENKREKGNKRGPKKEAMDMPVQEEDKEPEMTAMQIAWQEALNKANADRAFKIKRSKSNVSREQEDLLERTMKKRLPTGG